MENTKEIKEYCSWNNIPYTILDLGTKDKPDERVLIDLIELKKLPGEPQGFYKFIEKFKE